MAIMSATAGKPPRRLRAAPLHRGDRGWTWVAFYGGGVLEAPIKSRPNPRPYPLCGGVPPQGRGGFPAPCAVALHHRSHIIRAVISDGLTPDIREA
ncbi:MAG: hypothetical protein LBM98_06465 [Oscillospiraceae bacterium]|nr:hypothetical protein [Oscillospiraceae bacterium]